MATEAVAGGLRFTVEVPAGSEAEAREVVLRHWDAVASYLRDDPAFRQAMGPLRPREDAPPPVVAMAEAASTVGVAPMVAFPGALVEAVCRDLARLGGPAAVSVEGDTFVAGSPRPEPRIHPLRIPRLPGRPALGVRVTGSAAPYAFYSSSARRRIDPHVGTARVAVRAASGALADAVASALGLTLTRPGVIDRALTLARRTPGLHGVIVFSDSHIGLWGDVELVALERTEGEPAGRAQTGGQGYGRPGPGGGNAGAAR